MSLKSFLLYHSCGLNNHKESLMQKQECDLSTDLLQNCTSVFECVISQAQWTRNIWHGACCGRVGDLRMNSDIVGAKQKLDNGPLFLGTFFSLPA